MVMLNGTVKEVPSGTQSRTKQIVIHWATMKFVENPLNQNPYLRIANMINGYVEIFVSVKIYHAMVLVTVFQVSNITDGNAMINWIV